MNDKSILYDLILKLPLANTNIYLETPIRSQKEQICILSKRENAYSCVIFENV